MVLIVSIVIVAGVSAQATSWTSSLESAKVLLYDELGNDNALRAIYGGNLWVFKWRVDDLNLAVLSRWQLRLLRNTIFAQYGRRFASEELQMHFSRFSWYEPLYDNVSDQLTELDRENIERIRLFEAMSPTGHAPESTELVGVWHVTVQAPSGYPRSLVFGRDGTFTFYYSSMNILTRVSSFWGTYGIHGDVLELRRDGEEVLEGGTLSQFSGPDDLFELVDAEYVTREVWPPIVMRFPVSEIVEGRPETAGREMVVIGNTEYFRWTTKPMVSPDPKR